MTTSNFKNNKHLFFIFSFFNKLKMLDLITHNIFLPLTPTVYNRKILKSIILSIWLYIFFYLCSRSVIDLGNNIPIMIFASFFLITNIYMNLYIFKVNRYNWITNWSIYLFMNIIGLIILLMMYFGGVFVLGNANRNDNLYEKVDWFYKIFSSTAFTLLIIYILKNFFFLRKNNMLIPSNDMYSKQSRSIQLIICLVLVVYIYSTLFIFFSENVLPILNLLNAFLLIFLFAFLNFQLYKILSNNISLFPIIYKYKEKFLYQ